jgi:ATP-dependent protease HslVU (ClpYQ) peptidase subunit
MAADSLINVYERPIPDGARKIRRLKAGDGEALIGVAGHSGVMAIAGNLLTIDATPDDEDPQPWAEAIAVQATRLAVEHSLLDDGTMNASLLLGWQGRLWTLSHATAIPHRDGIAAIGSGEGPAIGAIDALLAACPDMPPQQVVARALAVAIERDKHSGGTVWMEYLPAVAA